MITCGISLFSKEKQFLPIPSIRAFYYSESQDYFNGQVLLIDCSALQPLQVSQSRLQSLSKKKIKLLILLLRAPGFLSSLTQAIVSRYQYFIFCSRQILQDCSKITKIRSNGQSHAFLAHFLKLPFCELTTMKEEVLDIATLVSYLIRTLPKYSTEQLTKCFILEYIPND